VVIRFLAGSASVEFAQEVCQILDVPMARADVKRFSDGEISNSNLRERARA